MTEQISKTDVARMFAKKVKMRLEDESVKIILFGSVARGSVTKDSDIDILVVFPKLKGRMVEKQQIVSEIATEFMMDYRENINAKVISEGKLEELINENYLFGKEIEQDGIIIG